MESFRKMMQSTGGRVFLAIVLVIFVLFAFGTSFYTPPGARGEIAVVNEYRIMSRELDREYERRLSQYAGQVDRKTLEQMIKRDDVLDSMIRQRVTIDAALADGLIVDPALVQKAIMDVPEFQDETGKFSQEQFQQLVMRKGFASAATFREWVEEMLLVEQVNGALADSAFATRQELELLTRMGEQRRDVAWVLFTPEIYLGQVQVTPEEAQAKYDADPAGYMSAEQFAVEYLEVNLADYAADQKVDEAEVQAKYQDMVTMAQQNAERRVAHILIAVNATRDEAAARARADEVLGKLNTGETFASLAAGYSDDSGSKAQGGDLGFVSRGVLDEALDNALFTLRPGDVSTAVKTPDGIHLLKLLEVREVAVPSLPASRADIVAGLARDQARSRFDEIVEKLGALTYESDNLDDPAKELGLQVRRTGLFGRDGGPGIAANPKVMAEVVADEVLLDGRNSAVISLADGQQVVVLRLLEHRKAARRPFMEVSPEIAAALRREKAQAVAVEKARSLADALRAGTPMAAAAQSFGLKAEQMPGITRAEQRVPRELVKAAFGLKRPAAGAWTADVAELEGGRKAVVVVSNVVDGSLLGAEPSRVDRDRGALAGELGSRDFQRWLDVAVAQADITRLDKKSEEGFLDAIMDFKESIGRP